MNRIYADNAATTAVSDASYEAMLPYFKESYGNPSAIHSYGTEAKRALENARRSIADCIGARVNEIYFTSGGTESDNWALQAACRLRGKGRHIITTAVEHSAVYRSAQLLEKSGYQVTFLPVDSYGMVTPEQLEEAIREDTVLVSIMLANNEIGTIQPIEALCQTAKQHRVLFHTDAVQAVGHIPVDVRTLGVDMLSMSAHKFHGPKGIGALYVNIRTALPAMLQGGGQEKGKRSGTVNVAGAVGMAAALQYETLHMEEHMRDVAAMRDRLIDGVVKLPGATLTGHPGSRLPGLASFIFKDIQGEPLVSALNEAGICASAGSACSAGSGEPSRVLGAAGVINKGDIAAPLRLSLGTQNTMTEVSAILAELPNALKKASAERVVTDFMELDDYE